MSGRDGVSRALLRLRAPDCESEQERKAQRTDLIIETPPGDACISQTASLWMMEASSPLSHRLGKYRADALGIEARRAKTENAVGLGTLG